MVLSKKRMTIIVVALAVLVVVGIKFIGIKSAGVVDPVAARTIGPKEAKVNVVEFIDFECPACAAGALKIKDYRAKYPNDMRIHVKYYPLMNIHRHALQVASYAECAARQDKFWPFFETLMSQQGGWSQLVNAEVIFDQIAEGAKLNMKQLKTCVSSEGVSVSIMSEKTLGRSMGVQSTPTYFINNKMVVGTKSLQEELDQFFPQSLN